MEYNSTELGQRPAASTTSDLIRLCLPPSSCCSELAYAIEGQLQAHTGAQRDCGRSSKRILPCLSSGPHQEPSPLTAPACLSMPQGAPGWRQVGTQASGSEEGTSCPVLPGLSQASLSPHVQVWHPPGWVNARALSEPRESTDLGHGIHRGKSISGSHN